MESEVPDPPVGLDAVGEVRGELWARHGHEPTLWVEPCARSELHNTRGALGVEVPLGGSGT